MTSKDRVAVPQQGEGGGPTHAGAGMRIAKHR